MSESKRNSIYSKILQAHGVVRCYCCGLPVGRAEATLEHIIPRSLGGEGHRRNLSISHQKCNSRRGHNVAPEEAQLVRARPKRLHVSYEDRGLPPPEPPRSIARIEAPLHLYYGDWDAMACPASNPSP